MMGLKSNGLRGAGPAGRSPRMPLFAFFSSGMLRGAGFAALAAGLRAAAPFPGVADLARVAAAESRAITAENPTGGRGRGALAAPAPGGAARDLGTGWKTSPSVAISPRQVATLAQMDGPGAISQIWMTASGSWRLEILRFYWDDEATPSVEVPLGDFFASAWGSYNAAGPSRSWESPTHCALFGSLMVCVNPGAAFNCYWPMPFRRRCRITLENLNDQPVTLFYQINYSLQAVPDDAAYFHAQFRRENPVGPSSVYTILDGVKGQGQYVGTYLAWSPHGGGWWGEGEVKFYLDGDRDGPTICGTGAEDYFGGAWGFHQFGSDGKPRYVPFSTPYSGMPDVVNSDGFRDNQQRFSLYRWHVTDPIRFRQDLRVTIQDLGWASGHRFRKLHDDLASVAFWYQMEPHAPFPHLPARDELDLNTSP